MLHSSNNLDVVNSGFMIMQPKKKITLSLSVKALAGPNFV